MTHKGLNSKAYKAISERNTSGVVGVALHLVLAREGVYVGWSALVMVNGVQRRKTWSIGKWGYEGAWKQALAYRSKMSGASRSRKQPPDRKQMSKMLKDRLGADWRRLVRPAFKMWW